MRGAAVSPPAVGSGFAVFLLSVAVVHGENKWGVTYSSTELCALEGSTIDISCSYTYPSKINNHFTKVEEKFWLNGITAVDLRADSEYAGRVQYHFNKNNCTLTIRNLKKSDSTKYSFRFTTNHQQGRWTGSPGVTLSVTDLQVRHNQDSSQLECYSSCPLSAVSHLSYVWYKNGQRIQGETSSYSGYVHHADSYSCAVKGLEDFPSTPVCVKSQFCNKVTYTDRSICAFRGSSVDISCSYMGYEYILSSFWFSPEHSHQWLNSSQPEDIRKDSHFTGRVREIGRSTLRISALKESDSAEYRFKFKTQSFEWNSSLPATTLTVTDPDFQVLVRFNNKLGSLLECHSRCRLPDHPVYIWYKNGEQIKESIQFIYSHTNPADSYSCALKGHEDFPSPLVCVTGQKCNRVVYINRTICAAKGSSVNIPCMYNSHQGHIQSKLWFSSKRSQGWRLRSQAGRFQVVETAGGRSTLRISDLTEKDSAEYHFKFNTNQQFEWKNSLPGTTLTVTALQVQVTTVRDHQSYTEAELTCHSSCSPAGQLSYVWFKNGQKVREERISYKGMFHPGDSISCALKGHEIYGSPILYALNVPSVSVSASGEIMEGSSVTLTCISDADTSVKYTWYKKYQTLGNKKAQLVFKSIKPTNSGEYSCSTENELGRTRSKYVSINVRYAPKLPSVSVSPSAEIVEGSSVTLTCSSDANPAADYTWYKGNKRLYQGLEGVYHFISISSEDKGIYSCKSENKHGYESASLSLDVQYAPKLPSVSVSPSAQIVEGSSVTLTCSSDANPAANYTWYKEDEDSAKAFGQNFTITDFIPAQSGRYYCVTQNARGRHRSAINLSMAVSWKAVAAGGAAALILPVICLIFFILIKKKRTFKQSSEPEKPPDSRDQCLPSQIQQEEVDIHYASIQFSKVRPAQRHGDTEENEDTVFYSVVKFSSGIGTRCEEAEEDPAALYSTINKTC